MSQPKRGKVNINYKRCKGCGICSSSCPRKVYQYKKIGRPRVVAEEKCTACMLCQYLCPDFAIKIEKIISGVVV
ncbi:ferredoxin family protein [Alkalicella caledoniensis]|uniref:Ferredoxin family protein n=1 Tax=Alkalicella caledoniensis TaxID=2731377 RepID=A0A7G9W5F1_ALKCA|nr:ferredoxin family protein [Alkalicella caledoniensis]QNO13913.1 ferredoxin family protein [Alkalicella caledoniensis]